MTDPRGDVLHDTRRSLPINIGLERWLGSVTGDFVSAIADLDITPGDVMAGVSGLMAAPADYFYAPERVNALLAQTGPTPQTS